MKSEKLPLDDAELPEDSPVEGEPEREAPAEDRGKAAFRMYLREISRIPLLTPAEERALALRAQAGDAEAERRMVEANLRLVFKIARGYVNRGLPLSDLTAEGNLGLLKAVRKFRPDKGTRFSTYATWWIRQSIVRALANQARLIRLPVHVKLLLARYLREKEALRERADLAEVLNDENERTVLRLRFGLAGGEPMTLEAIGRRMGLTRERVRQIGAAGLKKLRGLLASRGVDAADLFL